ncbi:unnamed protein product [Oppiella nova]|uniref:NR LBD domain-containing protein n=1 Tax=Oppiella nova TaxID=334625 RepID=A0A7R9QKS8_9ACAR|nr:unnamed protein product [Oppiella nova]CAG2167953.1 unnamed protein product [Oppiella nova]
MKREFILNDEERHYRRIKLEAKRKVRKNSAETIVSTNTSSPELTSFGANNTETNSNSMDMFTESANNANNMYSTLSVCTDTPTLSTYTTSIVATGAVETDFMFGFMDYNINNDNNSICSEQLIDEILENEYHNHHHNHQNYHNLTNSATADDTEISDEVYEKVVEFELSVIPIAQPIIENNTSLNDCEYSVLRELLNATQILNREYYPQTRRLSEITTVPDLRKTMSFIFEKEIQNVVNVMKGLSGFQKMCESDKIALLKNSAIETLFMRSVSHYNQEKDYITLTMDTNNSILIKSDIVKQVRRNLYGVLIRYYSKILALWDSDYVILDLLTAIIMFDPDKDNLIHKDVIKLQQNIYMHLLKRYLTTKYQPECESKTKFLRIMNTLVDIRLLGTIQRQNASDNINDGISKTYMSPLVKEIVM